MRTREKPNRYWRVSEQQCTHLEMMVAAVLEHGEPNGMELPNLLPKTIAISDRSCVQRFVEANVSVETQLPNPCVPDVLSRIMEVIGVTQVEEIE